MLVSRHLGALGFGAVSLYEWAGSLVHHVEEKFIQRSLYAREFNLTANIYSRAAL